MAGLRLDGILTIAGGGAHADIGMGTGMDIIMVITMDTGMGMQRVVMQDMWLTIDRGVDTLPIAIFIETTQMESRILEPDLQIGHQPDLARDRLADLQQALDLLPDLVLVKITYILTEVGMYINETIPGVGSSATTDNGRIQERDKVVLI